MTAHEAPTKGRKRRRCQQAASQDKDRDSQKGASQPQDHPKRAGQPGAYTILHPNPPAAVLTKGDLFGTHCELELDPLDLKKTQASTQKRLNRKKNMLDCIKTGSFGVIPGDASWGPAAAKFFVHFSE